MLRVIIALGFVMAASAAAGADAQNRGAYTGVSVGQSDVKFGDFGLSGLAVSESRDETDTAYKLLAGYRLHRYFAVEGGYTNLGKFTDTFSGAGGTATVTAKAAGFHLDAVALLPRDQWDLFAKLGAVHSTTKTSFSASGALPVPADDAKKTEWNFKWGFGAEYRFSRRLSWRAEYELVKSVGDPETTGESDVKMVSVGLVLRF